MGNEVYISLDFNEIFAKSFERYGHFTLESSSDSSVKGEDALKKVIEDAAIALVAYNVFSDVDCMEYLSQINEASKRLVDAVLVTT